MVQLSQVDSIADAQQRVGELARKFKLLQAELRTFERELDNVHPVVRQLAAVLTLKRWVDKSEGVLQQLTGIKLV